jgi:hypothetical protein
MTRLAGPEARAAIVVGTTPAPVLARPRTCRCQRWLNPTNICAACATQWGSAQTMRSAEPVDEGSPGRPLPDLGRTGRADPGERWRRGPLGCEGSPEGERLGEQSARDRVRFWCWCETRSSALGCEPGASRERVGSGSGAGADAEKRNHTSMAERPHGAAGEGTT